MPHAMPILAAVLALGASSVLAAEPIDAFERKIAIGRLEVLIGHADAVLDGLGGVQAEPEAEDQSPAGLYVSLYATALDMEALRARACTSGKLTGRPCARRFSPPWLRPPGSFRPSLRQVARWTDQLQDEALSLTSPICELAPADPEGLGACAVE